MKSGLEGRNNAQLRRERATELAVSMKSGLEGRNNTEINCRQVWNHQVSMKSGLEGRNNGSGVPPAGRHPKRLNEVRPRRPEQ